MGVLTMTHEFEGSAGRAVVLSFEFLRYKESRIRSSFKFAPFEFLSGYGASIPDSIKPIEAASVNLSLAGRNPSAKFLTAPKDNEVELVIHSINLIPANLNLRKRVLDDDALAAEDDTGMNKTITCEKPDASRPEEGAYCAKQASIDYFLKSKKGQKDGRDTEIDRINPWTVNVLFQRSSYARWQSKQKRKLAS